MKASCVLCGEQFDSVPDLSLLDATLREQREFADVGRMAMHHLSSKHRKTIRGPFTDPDLTGPLPIPALIGAVGMCAQNAVATSYLKSEDPQFAKFNANLAIVVTAAMKQVDVAPTVTIA
jgi:hypothetical protein